MIAAAVLESSCFILNCKLMIGHKKLPGELRMRMETFFLLRLDTMKISQSSIMNIVCRWDVTISLLMTAMVMEYVVVTMVMDITKEMFMVGKRFSMVANSQFKKLNIFVEKIFALLQRIILLSFPPLRLHHLLLLLLNLLWFPLCP